MRLILYRGAFTYIKFLNFACDHVEHICSNLDNTELLNFASEVFV